ncbi:hypothetical protein L1987_60397 [Smallanthus sonchifolius]|uniref:Uncharacterized protein n=1 Tax=Smallanthus sonchifolius TaxID=185202 RepID=A0ACB9D7X1_9ASTR|nr:hypothetical protein L1987_60397 [Smallanthus sonchifolius]
MCLGVEFDQMDKDMEDVDSDKRVGWLHLEQYSAAGNVFGEPKMMTRVGDAYQAQIPSLMTQNERSRDDQNHFEFCLSIPVTWVHYHKNKEETNYGFLPVPCSSVEESWSAIERDGFLLGLYIFGKNLGVVSNFVGSKGMPNVVAYYYGKFYRSGQHQKWSTYRKKRSRKSMPGKWIFSGWRRQELLSRVLPNVTNECKSRLTQVVRMFDEGKLPLEKYVFAIRDIVGINLLIESIAIGKGKQDLSSKKPKGMLKSKQIQSKRVCLKTEEIVNSLNDRMGLSKKRLTDLFWEVVWPRLLARGWHSEQPKNYAVQNSKNSLVFLAPGVTKFSRRTLEKGSQYFDSFTEVLNKVASEPHLLDHQPDPDRMVEPHVNQGPDDEQDLMKYTIVDTTLVGLVKVREVTSLPAFEPSDTQASTSVSRTKRQQVNNIINNNTSDEDEAIEKARYEKKRAKMVVDLNNPRMGPGPDSVLTETTTNQTELLNAGHRQSTRNRALTTKALEALANGFLNPKKRRSGPEDGARRRVRGKTALVASCESLMVHPI